MLGEAFGAVRILGQTITAYRQLINRPFINPQDSRMVPNTFEAYTLTGSADEVSYTGGYITKMKIRESESFVWMSNTAGGTGNQRGRDLRRRDVELRQERVRPDGRAVRGRRLQHVLRGRQVPDRDRRQDRR